MTTVQILYWFDIPLQVRAQEGRQRASRQLSERFQIAVDNASMSAGLTDSDEYLAMMRWGEPEERPGTPEEVADAVAAEIEARFEDIPWRETARLLRKGLA